NLVVPVDKPAPSPPPAMVDAEPAVPRAPDATNAGSAAIHSTVAPTLPADRLKPGAGARKDKPRQEITPSAPPGPCDKTDPFANASAYRPSEQAKAKKTVPCKTANEVAVPVTNRPSPGGV
ncbi:MAG: hypothetical protein H7138_17215, partial [Myxococcales bacterium]|nr:hypothetical protein [Myxococcales bacterium]